MPGRGQAEVGQEDDREQRDVLEQLGVDRRRASAARRRSAQPHQRERPGRGPRRRRSSTTVYSIVLRSACHEVGRVVATRGPGTARRSCRSSSDRRRASSRRAGRRPGAGPPSPATASGTASGSPPYFLISLRHLAVRVHRVGSARRSPVSSFGLLLAAGRSRSCTGWKYAYAGCALTCAAVGGVRYCVLILQVRSLLLRRDDEQRVEEADVDAAGAEVVEDAVARSGRRASFAPGIGLDRLRPRRSPRRCRAAGPARSSTVV